MLGVEQRSMEELISEKRKDGVFLTVLGLEWHYKDSKMKFRGQRKRNYAYIDSFQEAQKVLVMNFGGTCSPLPRT